MLWSTTEPCILNVKGSDASQPTPLLKSHIQLTRKNTMKTIHCLLIEADLSRHDYTISLQLNLPWRSQLHRLTKGTKGNQHHTAKRNSETIISEKYILFKIFEECFGVRNLWSGMENSIRIISYCVRTNEFLFCQCLDITKRS